MQKVLLIILIVLGIVVIGEFVMYLRITQQKQTPIAPIVSNISPSPEQTIVCATPTPVPNAALNPEILASFGRIRKGILVSSLITNTYHGIITEITEPKHSSAILAIRIANTQENTTNIFYYSNNDVKKIKVTDETKNPSMPITFRDLKIGDPITVTETIDLTNKSNTPLEIQIKKEAK